MRAIEKWDNTTREIKRWFQEPDMEGVMIALCVGGSHYYPQEKAVWLQVIGASGSGKTELAIQACKALPLSRIIGDLTPKAFLSSAKGPKNSLLPPLGGSMIWLAKDFTTIYSMRPDDRKEVAARLREVWDGEIYRDTGQGPTLGWYGKVTMIAAATPEVEEHWGALRALGERFLTLKWRSPVTDESRIAAMQKSRTQLGHVKDIREDLAQRIQDLCDPRTFASSEPPSDEVMQTMDITADLVALLRVKVERDYDMRRSIISIGTLELPTRISAGLAQIIRTHQAIFTGELPIDDSLRLARRVARDTIPTTRRQVLHYVPIQGKGAQFGDILRESRIPRTTLQRTLEELVALDVLDRTQVCEKQWEDNTADFAPDFAKRRKEAGLTF